MILSFETRKIKYTYIYFITRRCNLVHVSFEVAFKTAFHGESNVVYSELHNAYYDEPILR